VSIGYTNEFSIGIDVISFITILTIAYYSIKLLLIMRNRELERSWRFVSIGSFLFVSGVAVFGIVAAVPQLQMPNFIFNLGGLAMMSGGFFLLLGLRVQYNIFHIK